MNIKQSVVFILLLLPIIITAKEGYEKFNWEANPTIHKLSADYEKESAVIIENLVREEYVFNSMDGLDLYKTIHKIIRVNDDKAIERFNKVFISINDVESVVELKARSVSKDGKVNEVDKNSIKMTEQNESDNTYKIFAIDGLEKGSEVEYYFILKKYPSFFGREFMQQETPFMHNRIEIITPEKIIFKAKSYNNFPELKDSVMDGKHWLTAEANNISELQEEEYAFYYSNLMRVESKLDKNLKVSDKETLTWEDAAQSVYNRIYVSEKNEGYTKKIDKIIKKELHLKGMDEASKIKTIESYIKTNYLLKPNSAEGLNSIDNILKNKYAATTGLIKLFAAFFKEADIKCELVLTTDKKNILFDSKFDTWNNLEEYLFYFPKQDRFIAPTETSYRYPLIPFYWTDNDGLFIENVVVGESQLGIGKKFPITELRHQLNHIPAFDAEFSYDDHDIKIEFNADLSDATMHIKRSISGFNAMPIQPYIKGTPSDKIKEACESLLKDSEKDAKISNMKTANIDPDISPYYKPFILEGDLQGTGFLEKAGNDYLFKIGTIIGPQTQLYAEKKRACPIEHEFNRRYDRTITFNIPKGYKIKNLNDLNVDVYHLKDNERDYSFTSSNKIEGDKVIVDVKEFYKSMYSPVTEFEAFRKVINASADFNKVTLVIEKE